MEPASMPGLSTVLASSRNASITLIDKFELKDYGSGASLASTWRKHTDRTPLIIDLIDANNESSIGDYILSAYPDTLLEGILITKQLINPSEIQIFLNKTTVLPEIFRKQPHHFKIITESSAHNMLHHQDCVIHNAETLWAIARFFRREGADKRIWQIVCAGRTPVYRIVPLVYNLRTIAAQENITHASHARIGGKNGYIVSQENFGIIPPISHTPIIEFFTT